MAEVKKKLEEIVKRIETMIKAGVEVKKEIEEERAKGE